MDTWDGRPVELKRGDTATAKNMERDQLHGVFFHNPGIEDVQVEIKAPWTGRAEKVSVPGSRPGGTMPMAIAFWYDEDPTAKLTSVSVEVVEGGPVTVFICDLTLPMTGVRNLELQEDQPVEFDGLTRFYHMPATQPYVWELNSSIEAFVAVCFRLDRALVVVLNHDRDRGPCLHPLGGAEGRYTVVTSPGSTLREHLLGNAQQLVWINAIPVSRAATIRITTEDTERD
jgi:hypothetical protein